MLEHHAKLHAGPLGRLDQAQRALARALERLLQEDVLARGGEALHQLQVCVGRRQDHHHVDRRVIQGAVEIAGEREVKALGERTPPRLAAAEGVGDLDPILQIEQAFGVRADGHAEADHGDAVPGHDGAFCRRASIFYYACWSSRYRTALRTAL